MALRWSAHLVDQEGATVHSEDAARIQPTASIGKVFILKAVADGIASGTLDPRTLIARPGEAVADSGLWQHLAIEQLPVADLAVLTASVSDNLAANALLDVVGGRAVDAASRSLGCERSRVLDRIRDDRTPDDPIAPSIGCADELANAVAQIARSESAEAELLRNWLRTGVDLSMVASAFGLDPLAHLHADRGISLWNKTGTDSHVRADIGVVTSGGAWLAYAALAEWDPDRDQRDEALARMRDFGERIRRHLTT